MDEEEPNFRGERFRAEIEGMIFEYKYLLSRTPKNDIKRYLYQQRINTLNWVLGEAWK